MTLMLVMKSLKNREGFKNKLKKVLGRCRGVPFLHLCSSLGPSLFFFQPQNVQKRQKL